MMQLLDFSVIDQCRTNRSFGFVFSIATQGPAPQAHGMAQKMHINPVDKRLACFPLSSSQTYEIIVYVTRTGGYSSEPYLLEQ